MIHLSKRIELRLHLDGQPNATIYYGKNNERVRRFRPTPKQVERIQSSVYSLVQRGTFTVYPWLTDYVGWIARPV